MSRNSGKRKFKFVTSASSEGQSETTEIIEIKTKTEWTKCMLCQNDKLKKVITLTESNKQGTSKNTFQRIEEDLRKFQEAGFRDVNLDRFCKNGRTFVDTCILNHAKFHKTGRNSFDNYHFEWLKKNPPDICKTPGNTKKIATRSSFSSRNFHSTCIFCDKSTGYSRIARIFDIDRSVREGALLLSDEKLIAKLIEGDMHADEAKYHANCLCNFYSKLRTIEKQGKDYYKNFIKYNIVLSEVVNFIKKTPKTSQMALAFILSDLKKMHFKSVSTLHC